MTGMRVLDDERRALFAWKVLLYASLSDQPAGEMLRTGKIPSRRVTIDGTAVAAAISELILADAFQGIAGTAR